jgi:hypothetical protein
MTRWFYRKEGRPQGPLTAAQIGELLAGGRLQDDDWVWPEGKEPRDGRHARDVTDAARVSVGTSPLPDWLQDVARQQPHGPVPGPSASPELPDWLEDLRLWYGLGEVTVPLHAPLPVQSQQRVPGGPSPRDSRGSAPTRLGKTVVMTPDTEGPGQPAPSAPPATAAAAPTPPPLPAGPPPPRAERESVPATGETVLERAVREIGFDPRTGQVLDPVQFAAWERQQASLPVAAGAPTNATLMEVFRQARIAVENWVDDEGRRPLILRGDVQEITRDGELAALLQQFAGYGPVMREKLLRHLAFLVENRRKYYSARPD